MEMEMNGNLSNHSSTNSNYNGFDSNAGLDSAGPMTSTPISERSMDGGDHDHDHEIEQPTSTSFTDNGLSCPKFGTLIPNRVFVGGISCQTTESELLQIFSKYGAIRGTKIIMDRAGVSKGYGFVTFETEDEAKRLLNSMNHRELPPIVHRDRRLNIAPAVKKQPMMRQNLTYGSQGSVGASSTFSPPPFDSFYYAGQSSQGDFFGPPVPQESYFPQSNGCFSNGLTGGGGFSNGISTGLSNGYSNGGLSNGYASTPTSDSMGGPYYTSIPNLGMGQAIQGPNGSIIFLPMGMPSMPSMPSSMPCQQLNWIMN